MKKSLKNSDGLVGRFTLLPIKIKLVWWFTSWHFVDPKPLPCGIKEAWHLLVYVTNTVQCVENWITTIMYYIIKVSPTPNYM